MPRRDSRSGSGIGRALVVPVALMAALAPAAHAQAPGAWEEIATPGAAAYCGRDEWTPNLVCWTPNDGFTVWMTPDGRPHKAYVKTNRNYTPKPWKLLAFGKMKNFADDWSCVSRRNGLTCTNGGGHGWWLGRYVGYRVF
jgi:hypothetical protein